MKRSGMAAVGSITLSVLVAGCGSAGVSTTPAQSSTPTHGATAQEAGIGDTINLSDTANGDDIAVTVVKVADPDAAEDGFSTPPAGDRFVSVQYRIVNTGKGSYQDDPFNEISAKDAAGQTMRQEIAIATSAGAQLPSSMNLAPGDTSLGYVTFDVPSGDKIAQTQYTLNLGFTGATGEWQIGHVQTQPPASPHSTASAHSTGPAAPAPPATAAGSAQSVVEAYFAAINARNYALAWSLGGVNIQNGSYNQFVQGFASTSSDAVTVVSASGDTVTVRLDTSQTDGSQKHFAGTYTVKNGVIVAADVH